MIIADLTTQVEDLKARVANTTGQVEEIGHRHAQVADDQAKTMEQKIAQLEGQVQLLLSENRLNKEEIQNLKAELKRQKKFTKSVTNTLVSMTGATKSSSNDKLKKAHKLFEKNKQKKAKDLYLEVLAEEKINAAQRNHVYFNLGLLDYWSKNYNDSIVYFSKIYTKYPKSSYAPRSLLYIGRNFKKLNKSDEAKATFNELLKNYPKAKQVKYANEELKSL